MHWVLFLLALLCDTNLNWFSLVFYSNVFDKHFCWWYVLDRFIASTQPLCLPWHSELDQLRNLNSWFIEVFFCIVFLLPDWTLHLRIHRWSHWAFVCSGEVVGVRERAKDSDWPWRMYWRTNFCKSVFRSHWAAPNLCVVQEK